MSGTVTAKLRRTAGVGLWAQHPIQLEGWLWDLAVAGSFEVGISEWGMWTKWKC